MHVHWAKLTLVRAHAHTHTHTHSHSYSFLITHKPGDKISVKDFLLNVRRGVLQWFSPYTIVVNGLEIRM